MAILNIRKEDDPILRKTSRPVEEITPRIRTLIADMIETMRAANGCGLAAVQVTDSGENFCVSVAAPILCEGDVLGLVLFAEAAEPGRTGETEYKLAQTIAAFLGRHMES